MEELMIAIVSAVVGGIIASFRAFQRARLELLVKTDETLRKDRVEAYKALWEKTGLLSLYPPKRNVAYSELAELSEKFRDWYFKIGGIYLSTKARDAYFEAQKTLLEYAEKAGIMNPYDETGKYNRNSDYELVRNTLSRLRTQLTEDLDSRRAPGLQQLNNDIYS
jgi:hypothetical protein